MKLAFNLSDYKYVFYSRLVENFSNNSCVPIEFSTLFGLSGSNNSFTLCIEQGQNLNKFTIISMRILNECSRACKILQFSGKMESKSDNYSDSSKIIYLGYWFNHENEMEVFQEYLIYEITGIIGSIGGTLGLFVGFSFLDLSTKLIDILKKKMLNANSLSSNSN